MKYRNLPLTTALLLAAIFLFAKNAEAWAFYWSKVEVQTSSWQNCMTIANAVAHKQHLTGITRNNLEVAGKGPGGSASITCIGTGGNSKAMAVVMVVGDADGPVRQLRDVLASGVNRERIID